MVSGFVLVAAVTVGSKGVSFLKDAVVARQFGTGDVMDAFGLSFGFLTFLAALLGGGLPEAFLPVYAETALKRGPGAARRLAIESSLAHLASLLLLAGGLYLAAPFLVGWAAQGFAPEKQALAVTLLRQLLPFLVCFGMSYQVATWLRADKSFLAATAAPMAIPVTILVCLLTAEQGAGVERLVAGTLLGALIHLLLVCGVAARSARTQRGMLRSLWRTPDEGLRRILRNTAPYLFAGGIFSSTVVVDQTMASWLAPGSVAVLGYTDKLCGIILAVTAGPACDVLFPYFADKVARQDWLGVRRQLFSSAASILALALPATLALCVLAPWVVGLLFERGSFTAADTIRVAGVLRYAALQIPFYILATLAARVVVAMQATRFIMVLSGLGLVLNAALNWVLMQQMGVAGIALSTMLVQMMSAGVACLFVLRRIQDRARQIAAASEDV
jgi:putative peptidoglycan lipid II flippase